MLPRVPAMVSKWFQHLPGWFATRQMTGAGVLETRLAEGDSLAKALELALPRMGSDAVRRALEAEDGPVALVCVDLLAALDRELRQAADQLGRVDQPWARWTSARLEDFAQALEHDVVHAHLVNAVLAEAAVTSELIPIEVKCLSRQSLERRVVQVLLTMRSTVFTRADLVQSAATLGRAVSTRSRLAESDA